MPGCDFAVLHAARPKKRELIPVGATEAGRPTGRYLIAVFYFFQRGSDFLQCEIRGDDAAGYEIVITEPRHPERREQFSTSNAAYERWLRLQEALVSEGWWGPHGRD